MELIEYQRMYEQEDHHWWFRSRLFMTEGLLRRYVLPEYNGRKPRLLDLGCGTGLFLERRQADCDAFGADFSAAALHFCHQRHIHRLVHADAARLPFADQSFDIVTAFDLIEHVPADGDLVSEVHRILKPGGFFIASVPAHPILWTGHDISLHHRRRYRGRQFDQLFFGESWQRIRMSSGFCLVFLPAALVRLSRRLFAGDDAPSSDTATPPAAWFNRLMIALHRIEAALLVRHDLPVGVSYFTIRRKK